MSLLLQNVVFLTVVSVLCLCVVSFVYIQTRYLYHPESYSCPPDLPPWKLSLHCHPHRHADNHTSLTTSSSESIVVALLVPVIGTTTVRSQRQVIPLERFPLLTIFLPSLFQSIRNHTQQRSTVSPFVFRYVLYLGFDEGDLFLSNSSNVNVLHARFDELARSYPLSLKVMSFSGMNGAPCWVWNALADQALHDGSHYLYQLNDDVRFESPGWTELFVETLRNNSIHGDVGVTGPIDNNNTRIFTQSFVSRLHLVIFDSFYPKVFKNWWSDDWITQVYHPRHSFRTTARVHNTNAQGTRYTVAWAAQFLLSKEVSRGRELIDSWLLHPRH